jgi:hypothetical protein
MSAMKPMSLASGLVAAGDWFGHPALIEEAVAILVRAEVVVAEREDPVSWAQVQLLLDGLSRRLSSPPDTTDKHQENLTRAREILTSVGKSQEGQVASASEEFLEFIDGGSVGVKQGAAMPDIRPAPQNGPLKTAALVNSAKAVKRARPQYLLETDYRKVGSIEQDIAILDRVCMREG